MFSYTCRSWKFGEAEKVLRQAAALDPQDLKPRLALFRFYATKKKFDQATAQAKYLQKEIENLQTQSKEKEEKIKEE